MPRPDALRPGDGIPGRPVGGLTPLVRRHVVAQELLLGALGGQHIGVEQGVELAAERLVTVFDAEQLAAGVSRLLFALLA
jgi:hypothetical protein